MTSALPESMQTNTIYCGDCQHVLSNTNEFPDECVDLIYVDPPFFSNKQYEVLWEDGYELRSFEDRWKGGIENYIAWMEQKLRECWRILKKTGSMYLHCDYHANAYLRILIDKIFGDSNFKNEIIWQRTYAHSPPNRYGNVTDHILFYTKSTKYTWNIQYQEYSKHYIDDFFRYSDNKGKYRLVILTGSGIRHGKSGDSWKGYDPTKISRHWAVPRRLFEELKIPEDATPQEALNIMEKSKRIIWSDKRTPSFKEYLEEMPGMPIQNLWNDVPLIHSQSEERLGYPTQKPEALLERIIKASSKKNDVVLDPMCGCGTAIAVAHKLGRRWIGIDVSPTACKLMVKRMHKLGIPISDKDIIGMPKTLAQIKAMQPFDFQNWVIQRLQGRVSTRKVGDMGIDGYLFDGTPIQVKQSESVGRNVIDNFETAIKRAKKQKGIIVAFSFGSGSYEEVARAKNQDGIEIILKTVEEIIGEE